MSDDNKRLPRAAYTDQAWHTQETESLFADAWIFAGLTSDLKSTGDFLTLSAGAFPLAVLRNEGGGLSGFHNLCRHRGAVLLEGSGNAGSTLICPYHRWTYGLDGSLRGVPHQAACFADLDRDAHGMKPAALGVFRDQIFINPNPAADFEDWIAPIGEHAWPHRPGGPGLREGPVLRYAMKCDWKVFVENALDGYHLAILHQQTLGGPPPQENLWERLGQHMVWHASDTDGVRHPLPAKAREDYRKAGAIPLAGAETADYGGVYYLFPNTFILATPYDFSISWLHPKGPGSCILTVRHWAHPDQGEESLEEIPGYNHKTGLITSDDWTEHPLETGDFQTEDVWICEKVQRGLASPAFQAGPLARGVGAEDPLAWFQDMLLDRLSA